MIENKWLTMALYPGCVQGFFLVYLLWRKKDANRQAIWYLNSLLLTISILMLLRVSYQPAFFKEFAEIILLPDVILFLTGPFIFLFTRALLRLDPLPRPRLLPHFIPAAIHVLVLNTFLGLHLKGMLHYLNIRQIMLAFNMIEAASMISLGLYIGLSLRTYQRYQEAFYEKYAALFVGQFLRFFLYVCLALLTIWLAGFVEKVLRGAADYYIYTLFWVLLVAAVYFLAYKIWSTPEVLELPEVLIAEPEAVPDVLLNPETISLLEQYMNLEKPFLNPEIKIGDLAAALNLPKHQLSKMINQGFGRNFFDFMNGYRIQSFIRDRSDKKLAHLNTLELAFANGFNSKSAFNRAFLKETGTSPRSFFKMLEQHP